MGRHHFAKDVKVTVHQTHGGGQQRRAHFEGHDNRESGDYQRPRGGSVNRVWRRGDKRVTFPPRGLITKRGASRPKFDVSRVANVLLENDEDMGNRPSIQAGRARPAS